MKTKHLYGVAPHGGYCDVSKTLRGAKMYATRNGYNEVYLRFNCGYNVALTSEKISGRWVNV
jgi:hypothetical protein